ncbi:MAG TPA: hypothetical protein VIV65_11125 [Gemmatimonadaceae bacterium]|jgi:hypothetical protein
MAGAVTRTLAMLSTINKPTNSSKSGARSIELLPQEFHGSDALGRRAGQPVLQRRTCTFLLVERRALQARPLQSKFHVSTSGKVMTAAPLASLFAVLELKRNL